MFRFLTRWLSFFRRPPTAASQPAGRAKIYTELEKRLLAVNIAASTDTRTFR